MNHALYLGEYFSFNQINICHAILHFGDFSAYSIPQFVYLQLFATIGNWQANSDQPPPPSIHASTASKALNWIFIVFIPEASKQLGSNKMDTKRKKYNIQPKKAPLSVEHRPYPLNDNRKTSIRPETSPGICANR